MRIIIPTLLEIAAGLITLGVAFFSSPVHRALLLVAVGAAVVGYLWQKLVK